jgi:peptidoglycan/LPS O-acetylase OafA/YrhL
MKYFAADKSALRNNNFDFLRFALALAVIFSHSWPLALGTEANEPLGRLTGGRFTVGRAAVAFFFIISGFLITHSWLSDSRLIPFMRKRVLRIYPGFTVTVLVCALVVVPLASVPGAPFDLARRLGHAARITAGLQMYIAPGTFAGNPYPGTVNGSLWTIRYEFFCYVLLALAGVLGALTRPRLVLAALIGALVIEMTWTFFELWPAAWHSLSMHFAVPVRRLAPLGRARFLVTFGLYFLVGSAFYLHRARIPFSGGVALLAATALAASLASPRAFIFAAALPLCGAYLLFYTAFHHRLPLQKFGGYGDPSYGMYTYAFAIQQLVVMCGGAGSGGGALGTATAPLRLFFIAAPLSIVAGGLSWHLVEKHFVHRRSHTAKASNAAMIAPERNVALPL